MPFATEPGFDVPLPGLALSELVARFGGRLTGDGRIRVHVIRAIESAIDGALVPLVAERYVQCAGPAVARGAVLFVAESLSSRADVRELTLASSAAWIHPWAAWTLSSLLETFEPPAAPPRIGAGVTLGEHTVLFPRVVIGDRVRIEPGCVIGRPGFGWVAGPNGAMRAIPHVGGVVIGDDVVVGALSTVDAGMLGPTRLGVGVKLDAHCHVGHNTEIGDSTIIAAQCGFAGSVRIGRGVLIGGQAGVADHVSIGDRARIAAKSGVIADVPAGTTVAGYPAVDRWRWLRGMAALYDRKPRKPLAG